MAKKTPMTPAERKEQTANLKQALKLIDGSLAAPKNDLKTAEKALAVAKKEADKSVAAAQKAVAAMQKKADKAIAAHAKGKAKIDGQLAALVPPAVDPA